MIKLSINAVTRASVLKMNGPFAHDDVRAQTPSSAERRSLW